MLLDGEGKIRRCIKLRIVVIVIAFLLCIATLTVTGTVLGWFDTWYTAKTEYIDQKIIDNNSYESKKKVEDTCRSMISSYESYKLTYEQYKESEDKEEKSWASQAKMMANKTASTYNNYILKNSFVWKDNIPDDIFDKLEYIE
jgi:hypothetical protein